MVDLLLKTRSSNLMCVLLGASRAKEYFKILHQQIQHKKQPAVKYTDTAEHKEQHYLSIFSLY